MSNLSRTILLQVISLAIVSLGFVQVASGEIIGTQHMLEEQSRTASIARIELVMSQEAVASQLAEYGVGADMISKRLQGMTSAELSQLEQSMDQQIAGEGVLELVGAVFLVLLILELVGVTDIFKAI